MLIKFDFESDWLEARKKDVTSTEVAALFGLSPYKSRLRLWHEKAGNVEDDFEESPFSKWGQRLQNAVGLGICEDEGWQGFDLTGIYIRDPKIKSASSYDMKVICATRGTGNLEVKTAESFDEELGWFDDRAPIQYECQMQAQMNEAYKHGEPFDFSCLGTLGRRQKTRLYFREFDKEFGAMIDNEIAEFWDSIKKDIPPSPDYTVDGPLLEQIAKPVRMGETKNLSLDERANLLIENWSNLDERAKPLRDELKQINAEKDAIKYELHDIIGNAETVTIGKYIIGAKEQVTEERYSSGFKTRRFDVKKKR